MLVQYIVELIDEWDKQGLSEQEITNRILKRWPTLDEKAIRGIINYK